MTVGQLIEELGKLPPELRVVVDTDGGFRDMTDVDVGGTRRRVKPGDPPEIVVVISFGDGRI